jgi:hypothetical protein
LDQLIHRLARGAVGALVLLSLSACGTPAISPGSTPAAPSASPASTAPATLDASYPQSEKLIGELSSQRGINELGSYPIPGQRVAVYVRCVGAGSVSVEVVGAATFPNSCSPDDSDLGTLNTIDIRYVDKLDVKVTGDDSVIWAVALTIPEGAP